MRLRPIPLVTHLAGMSAGEWWRLLAANRFAVAPRYLLRAALITKMAALNSILRAWEELRFGKRVAAAAIHPSPIFVLGHWGSGTTHLHQLLACDERFAFPTLYQIGFPHTFLTTEDAAARWLAPLVPERRVWDNVAVRPSMPNEDEFAVALSGISPYLAWSFPRRSEVYEKHLALDDVSPAELARWQTALVTFLRKISFKTGGRPLVLKSPPHTARLRLLIKLFPAARFVHVRRHPVDVFHATRRLTLQAVPYFHLQRTDPDDVERGIVRRYRQLHDAFFRDRRRIPVGQLHELSYEDLERDPVGEIRRLYEALALPPFAEAEPALRAYLATIEGYQKNRNPDLPPATLAEIRRAWRPSFDAWGYA